MSGREVVELLVRKFGLTVRRQPWEPRNSSQVHRDRKTVTVVPLHPELKPGTLLGVLELAGISREEFLEAYGKDC